MKDRKLNHELREAFVKRAVLGSPGVPLSPGGGEGGPAIAGPGERVVQGFNARAGSGNCLSMGEGKEIGNAFGPRTPAILSLIASWLAVALLAHLSLRAATNSESEGEILKLSPPHAELPPSFWEQYGAWIMFAAVWLLALLGAAVWWWLKPKPALSVPIEIQSRKELEALRQRSEEGQVLSQISRVVRRYLTGAFELPPDELTTSEFCRAIAAHEKIGPDLAARVVEFLRQCDERKFAPAASPMPMGAGARALELVELGEARRAHLQKLELEAADKLVTRS